MSAINKAVGDVKKKQATQAQQATSARSAIVERSPEERDVRRGASRTVLSAPNNRSSTNAKQLLGQ